MSIKRPIALILLGFVCGTTLLSLTACHFPPRLYKMDVRQGNFITPEMLSKLKIGMSKETVRNIMGSPALAHFFQPNRWEYYYYLKPGNGDPVKEKRVTVYFKNDHVTQIKQMGVASSEESRMVSTELEEEADEAEESEALNVKNSDSD